MLSFFSKLKMPIHHTAFFQKPNKRKAEEPGGEFFGLAPLQAFLDDFNPYFKGRTRPLFRDRATDFVFNLMTRDARRNVQRIAEETPQIHYQSLHHFLSESPWSDQDVCRQISQIANDLLGGSPNSCLIIDPSSVPKKGGSSVGVAKQYCGNLGKIENCQVGVFAALGQGPRACLINKRLYLPRPWTEDPARCDKAGIPEDQRDYKSSQQLALELVEDADLHGVSYAWIGMDAEFCVPWLLTSLHNKGKTFFIDARSTTYVYPKHPFISLKKPGTGRRLRYKRKPVTAEELVKRTKNKRWRNLLIREGSKGEMCGEFSEQAVWIWDKKSGRDPIPCRLITKRFKNKGETTWNYKHSLTNDCTSKLKTLVYRQAQRHLVEQALREAKTSLGMDEYQVRKWRGWHHHVALTMVAALYIQKMRMNLVEGFPMLSVEDVRDLIKCFRPRLTVEEVLALILHRHELRYRTYESASRSPKARSPNRFAPM